MTQTLRQRRCLRRAAEVLRASPRRVHCDPDLKPTLPTQLQDLRQEPDQRIPAYVWIWVIVWVLVCTGITLARHLQ